MHLGYWTIYQGDSALASFPNFADAWSAIWEVSEAIK